nr:copper amine oxidase [Actinomycetota bacterium]
MQVRKSLKFVSVAAAISMLGVACASGTDGNVPAADGSPHAMQAANVSLNEGAPALDAGLTDLLDGHVYLAGIAIVEGVTNGLDSPQFKTAAATLDQNSQDLSAAIASVYGDAAGQQFLSLWRKHIGFFVDYTAGRATGDKAKEAKALKALENYKKDFSAFLAKATGGNLPASSAAQALQMHVDSLIDAINAVVDGKGDPFALLYTAAHEHMPATAGALSGAIAKQFPEKFGGSTTSAGAELQNTLTDLLDGHVYLAGIAIVEGVTNGLDSPQFKTAAATLDQNSQDLSAAIASVYGDAAGQ